MVTSLHFCVHLICVNVCDCDSTRERSAKVTVCLRSHGSTHCISRFYYWLLCVRNLCSVLILALMSVPAVSRKTREHPAERIPPLMIVVFNSWLSTGIAVVNKESFKKFLDLDRDPPKSNQLFFGPRPTCPKISSKSPLKIP